MIEADKFNNEKDNELFKIIKTQVELLYDSNYFNIDCMDQ